MAGLRGLGFTVSGLAIDEPWYIPQFMGSPTLARKLKMLLGFPVHHIGLTKSDLVVLQVRCVCMKHVVDAVSAS